MKLPHILLLLGIAAACASTETTKVTEDDALAAAPALELPRPEVRYYVINDV